MCCTRQLHSIRDTLKIFLQNIDDARECVKDIYAKYTKIKAAGKKIVANINEAFKILHSQL